MPVVNFPLLFVDLFSMTDVAAKLEERVLMPA